VSISILVSGTRDATMQIENQKHKARSNKPGLFVYSMSIFTNDGRTYRGFGTVIEESCVTDARRWA